MQTIMFIIIIIIIILINKIIITITAIHHQFPFHGRDKESNANHSSGDQYLVPEEIPRLNLLYKIGPLIQIIEDFFSIENYNKKT